MERLEQYYSLCAIRPGYQETRRPIVRPSRVRILMNLREEQLFFAEQFGTYTEDEKKTGGNDCAPVTVILSEDRRSGTLLD